MDDTFGEEDAEVWDDDSAASHRPFIHLASRSSLGLCSEGTARYRTTAAADGLPPRSRVSVFDRMEDMAVNETFRIVSLDLHNGDAETHRDNLANFFRICTEPIGLHVTTSCFTVWKKSMRLNGSAKTIPAVKIGSTQDQLSQHPLRIFFFDDNVQFEGLEDSPGICNLRDVDSAEFVPFGQGMNGFEAACVGRHTVVHHSSMYRNVIVKANILDALEDRDYFFNIVKTYTQENEKVIVFMDVNSTIMFNDTSAGKDVPSTLLSAMFELIELEVPKENTEGLLFNWQDSPGIRIPKSRTLKNLAKDVTSYKKEAYSDFWTLGTCLAFIRDLAQVGTVSWSSRAGEVIPEDFETQFGTYLKAIDRDVVSDGIASSWFNFLNSVRKFGRNTVILNSFGVDTRKVVLASVPDERDVMQICVNYELWSEQDVQKFEQQYGGALMTGPVRRQTM